MTHRGADATEEGAFTGAFGGPSDEATPARKGMMLGGDHESSDDDELITDIDLVESHRPTLMSVLALRNIIHEALKLVASGR